MSNRVVVFKEFSASARALANRISFPLKPGDRIWRPVIYYETVTERLGKVVLPQVLTPKFKENERKQKVIKIQKWGSNYVAQASEKKHGIIAFCADDITQLWTHFEVTSIGAKGKCAFVKPVYGEERDLIAQFKRSR